MLVDIRLQIAVPSVQNTCPCCRWQGNGLECWITYKHRVVEVVDRLVPWGQAYRLVQVVRAYECWGCRSQEILELLIYCQWSWSLLRPRIRIVAQLNFFCCRIGGLFANMLVGPLGF